VKRFLLDTNTIIYFLNGQYNLRQKIDRIGIENCFVSEITIAELKYGIEKSKKQDKNRKVIDDFQKQIDVLPIYPALDIYAKEKARLKIKGKTVDDFDLLIGATAIFNDLIIITKNTRHFKRLKEIEIEDWTIN
jgi:tRNA(fMet)-specific endonuclease VapC